MRITILVSIAVVLLLFGFITAQASDVAPDETPIIPGIKPERTPTPTGQPYPAPTAIEVDPYPKPEAVIYAVPMTIPRRVRGNK